MSTNLNIITAGIYIRKSREDKDKASQRLTVQREQLPAHAQSQGWQYIIYDDGHASAARGKIDDLKQRARLEADIRTGKINIVLCIELSRLSRDDSLQDYVAWLHLCSQHHVKLATLSRILDPAQHSDWMLLLMEGGFSSVEMRVLQGRMKEGRDQAFRSGKFLGGQVPPPYRYDHQLGRPVIDPQQLPRMQRIWQMAETTSVRGIAESIGEPLITVRRMLADDRLDFCLARRIDPEQGDYIPCDWEPCLTTDHADRIRANRVSRKSGYNRSHAAGMLTNLGLLICGHCGRSIRAWRGIDKRSGRHIPYAYYGCKANEHRRLCENSRMISQAEIDNRIITNIINTLANLEQLKAAWLAAQSTDDTQTHINRLTAEETSQRTRKERLIAAIADGVIDFADAKRQRQEIESTISAIQQQRKTLQATITPQPYWEALQITREDFDTFTIDEQREFITLTIKQIKFYNRYLILEYRFPRTTTGDTTSRVNIPPPGTPGRKPINAKSPASRGFI